MSGEVNMSIREIPQRESKSVPSPRVQAAAARLLVRADKQAKRSTPAYLLKLAETTIK